MDLKSNHASPVLTETSPINKSRLGRANFLPCSASSSPLSPGLNLTIPRKNGILDDIRAAAWVDAMKSSSPPPKMITKDINNDVVADEADVAYQTWMVILHIFLNFPCIWPKIVDFFSILAFNFAAKVSISSVVFWAIRKLCEGQADCFVPRLWWDPFSHRWEPWPRIHVGICKSFLHASYMEDPF